MEAARVLAYRGAQVQLWEKEEKVGGQLNIAVSALDKTWLGWLIEDQERELRRLGVKILLNKKATTETILSEDPDIVIIATGVSPKMEETSNLEGKGVTITTAWEILGGQWKPDSEANHTVVVWGGGRTGCEVAVVLAEVCQEVILITSRTQDQLARDYGNYVQPKMAHSILSHPRITLLEEHKVENVADGKVIVTSKKSPKNNLYLQASALITARGVKSVNDLADYPGKGLIVVVGDAKQPRDIKSAVHDGFVSAFYINLTEI
jgi:thioredoxin reductase